MSEDGVEFLRGEFVGVERKIARRVRFAEPLHVVLHEDLNNLAVDFRAALQRLPNAAAGGHVSAEFHSRKWRAERREQEAIALEVLLGLDSRLWTFDFINVPP